MYNYGGSIEFGLGIAAVIGIGKLLLMGLHRIEDRSLNKKVEKIRREREAAKGDSDSISQIIRRLKAAEAAAESATLAAQTKTCVYCAEDIKAAAIRCKHCGSFLPEV
jgi:hypothetical protein